MANYEKMYLVSEAEYAKLRDATVARIDPPPQPEPEAAAGEPPQTPNELKHAISERIVQLEYGGRIDRANAATEPYHNLWSEEAVNQATQEYTALREAYFVKKRLILTLTMPRLLHYAQKL